MKNLSVKFSQIINSLSRNKGEIYSFILIAGAFLSMDYFMMFNGWDAFIFSLVLVVFVSFFISFSLSRPEDGQAFTNIATDNHLEFINEQLDEMLLLVDHGKCVFVNPAVETVLAYSKKSFKKLFSKSIVHPEDQDLFQTIIKPIQSEVNATMAYELRILHKDGSYKWMAMTRKVCFSKKENKTFFVCSLRDISEAKATEAKKRVAEEIKQLEDQAKDHAKDQEISLTSLMAAHDLKEPLRTIRNYAQLLKARKTHLLDEEGQEFVEFIGDGAQRLEDLINDIRELSKMEHTKLQSDWVNPRSILLDVEKGLRQKIEDRNVVFDYQEMPAIEADPKQLKHVFQNIIENAIKYCREEQPKIEISCETQEDCWLFCVKDNGIGMNAEYLETIFTPFRRLHGNGEFEGTGIGLAICKKIIENHEGVIWAESRGAESGSSFYFTISKTIKNPVVKQLPQDKSQKSIFLKTKSLFKETAAMVL